MYKVSRPYILLSATYRLMVLYSLRLLVTGGEHIAMCKHHSHITQDTNLDIELE